MTKKIHFHLRAETRPNEARTPLTPEDAKLLLKNPNYTITVEKSEQRIFPVEEYVSAGCSVAECTSWVNIALKDEKPEQNVFVLGLKELPLAGEHIAENPSIIVPNALTQRHITFAHCYKGQASWKKTMSRFVEGKGELLDLEFLNFDNGRRVAAFGYAAGFAGMAAALLAWTHQHTNPGKALPKLRPYPSKEKLIDDIKTALAKCPRLPSVLVLGAKGRCGNGSVALAKSAGIADIIEWDMEETKKGGPFYEFLNVDILINDIYLTGKMEPYLTKKMVAEADNNKTRKLSVFCDVSCDVSNPSNPFPLIDDVTSFDQPTLRIVPESSGILPLDVIAIDHLPSLIPKESSMDFSSQIVKHLCNLHLVDFSESAPAVHDDKKGTEETRVWTRARSLFTRKSVELDAVTLRTLYPAIEPYASGMLKVSDIHSIYYEECGNPQGNPIVFVHGGPGGGCSEWNRCFFDPKVYRIILFDQRGAGRSLPFACLEENTTWDLVSDMEKLRTKLGIEKWGVFGGSWGSTLSLTYAETHPERVKYLILRGIFCLRRSELLFFYQEGSSWVFPEYFEEYATAIPASERFDLMSAYYRRLTNDKDEKTKLKCAHAWTKWEMATSRLHVDPEYINRAEDDKFALAFSRIECHYFVNAGFFKEDGELISNAGKLKNIPTVIVQGRYDMVCPMKSAWDLKKAMPHAQLIVVPDAGHSMKEPGILSELVKACDKFKNL